MTLNAKPRMDVVKRENKETRLTTFIADHLANGGVHCSGSHWLLVARSAESPVVLALAHFASELAVAGIAIRIILAGLKPNAPETIENNPIGFAADVRIARDLRLLDAHEQLYLDTATSWIGDCMRREPAKRDAYECHASGCTETARWTKLSFDRLWLSSEPTMLQREPASVAPVAETEPTVDAALASTAGDVETPSTALASTRH